MLRKWAKNKAIRKNIIDIKDRYTQSIIKIVPVTEVDNNK